MQDFNGRHVEGVVKCVSCCDVAIVSAVIVLGAIAIIIDRNVFYHSLGHEQTFVKGNPIQERLERTTWRAYRTHPIDLALVSLIIKILATDIADDS